MSAVGRSFALISRASRRRYVGVVSAQVATGLLDFLGVALIGLTALAASSALGGESVSLPGLSGLLEWPDTDPMMLAAGLAAAAAAVLLVKSVLYAVLLRANYRLLSRSQSEASTSLLASLLRSPLADIQRRPSQQTSYALINGATAAVTGLLGSLAVLVTDASLLVILGVGLLFVNPSVTIAAMAYLGLVAFILHASLSKWSASTGGQIGRTGIASMVAVQEGIGAYRELWALGRLGSYFTFASSSLEASAKAGGTFVLIGQIPKVVYDGALVLGALLIAAWQLSTATTGEALATLLVFLAAASRVIPSLLRVNGQLIQMRSYASQAKVTYDFADDVRAIRPSVDLRAPEPGIDEGDARLEAHVAVSGVTYSYPEAEDPALVAVDLDVPAGSSVAIVGPTGGGKSTLADVVIGLLEPQSGEVTIGGLTPRQAIAAHPGAIAYVPQRVALVDGTVRDNVGLAIPADRIDDEKIWAALARARLDEFVSTLPLGLDEPLGEHGVRLSGGQRQRVGLARALYSRPSLLVLDEATSALDAETEDLITRGIEDLHGDVTMILIAHRLASVQGADRVVYLDEGRLVAAGTFRELMDSSPAFARQVELLSLPRLGT